MPVPRSNVSLLGDQSLFEYRVVQVLAAPGQV
jgi:hypothetical protein